MPEIPRDEEREDRIDMEIIVDAYSPEEQALGWYYRLENNLQFPFRARAITKRSISPLRVGQKVEVAGMPPEEECEHDIFVLIRWNGDTLAVPLSQLEAIGADRAIAEIAAIDRLGRNVLPLPRTFYDLNTVLASLR